MKSMSHHAREPRRTFLKRSACGLVAGATWSGIAGRACVAQADDETGGSVASVRYLGRQFLDNAVDVTGADGATSTLLPSGESLWVFGDTIEGPFETIRGLDLTGFRSNTAAIAPRQDVSGGVKEFKFLATPDGKRPRQIIPFAEGEDHSKNRLWAIHGACVGARIYLYYHRITMHEDVDVFVNFTLDGMGIARAEIGEFDFTRLKAPDGTFEFWKGDAPSFGVFVQQDGDYLYLWGCLATGMHLARTRPEAIEDPDAYEYLVAAPTASRPNAKPRWSKSFEPTAVMFDGVPNEMSASYNGYLGKYTAFHSLHRESKIALRTAPHITGPWSEPHIIYTPEKVSDLDLIYATKEHPELAAGDGRVTYVTFVNSSRYIPEMIEVTLK